jgi:hypothetical protein
MAGRSPFEARKTFARIGGFLRSNRRRVLAAAVLVNAALFGALLVSGSSNGGRTVALEKMLVLLSGVGLLAGWVLLELWLSGVQLRWPVYRRG